MEMRFVRPLPTSMYACDSSETLEQRTFSAHSKFWIVINRCGYQSITQQYLKKCLIKDEVNYMFRPNVAIIRFSSESMALQDWYGYVTMVRSQHLWCLLYAIFKGDGGGVFVMCAILGCAAQVCLLAAVLCGFPVAVCPYPMSTAGGLLLWVVCACTCLPSKGCRIWWFGDRVADLFGDCRLPLWW